MSSMTLKKPAEMLDEYPSGIKPTEHEANRCWNLCLGFKDNAERPEQETVTIARHKLSLHATNGWGLKKLSDLTKARAFLTRRPGLRPDRDAKKALDAMNPAQFLRSFFERGVAFQAAPDDVVYTALHAYAVEYLGPGDAQAARRMTQAVVMGLLLRAGGEVVNSDQIGV